MHPAQNMKRDERSTCEQKCRKQKKRKILRNEGYELDVPQPKSHLMTEGQSNSRPGQWVCRYYQSKNCQC